MGVGRAIDDDVRPDLTESAADLIGGRDVELGPRSRKDLAPGAGQNRNEVLAKHARGPRDEHPPLELCRRVRRGHHLDVG